MKIGDIYIQCKKNYPAIKEIDITKDGDYHQIIGVEQGIAACENLKKIECLKEEYDNFMEMITDFGDGLFTYIDHNVMLEFEKKKNNLVHAIECIIKLYESTGLKTRKDIGLDIKFPVSNSFTDFRKDIDDLEFVLTKCPFFQDEKESLRLETVDIGSFWLTFSVVGGALVAGSVLLNNIAAFVDKCIIIRSHYLTTEKQKVELEKAKIEQKQKNEIIESLDSFYKVMVDNSINELKEKSKCNNLDGEEYGRAKQSLEKLGKLIDKGLQVYSTIDSPEEVKTLFEPLKMSYLSVNNKLKLIEEKSDTGKDNL